MKVTIQERKLQDEEIELLVEESRKFSHVGLLNHYQWKQFHHLFIAEVNNMFVGVGSAVHLNNWIKIGPIIILEQYQYKGIGKKLLTHIVQTNNKSNLYIGSSNPAIWSIVEKLGFRRENNFWRLPKEIQLYLFRYFFDRLNFEFIKDAISKKLNDKRKKYYYFLKHKTQ